MQVTYTEKERNVQNARFVKFDRKERNEKNAAYWTASDLNEVAELHGRVASAYGRSKVFKDINKTVLNVKVYKPTGADLLSEAVHTLNMSLENSGWEGKDNIDPKTGVRSITYQKKA
jgi:hypothetical protein